MNYPRYASTGCVFLVGNYNTEKGEWYQNHHTINIVTDVLTSDPGEEVKEIKSLNPLGDISRRVYLVWKNTSDYAHHHREYLNSLIFEGVASQDLSEYDECIPVLYIPHYPVSKTDI